MADPASLANLRDIVLPPAVPYWPPVLGWWIVCFTVLAMALLIAARHVTRYRHDAYRRAALRELEAIGPVRDAAAARRVSEVLKRVALVTFARDRVASLTGRAWLAFLDRTGRTDAFGRGPLSEFPDAGGEALAGAARRWIVDHRSTPRSRLGSRQGSPPC